MNFVWISEQTAITSLYSINWLVFITETECAYCAVRTEYLNIIQANISLWMVKQDDECFEDSFVAFVLPTSGFQRSAEVQLGHS
jgi:hypothetical protein